MRNPCPEEQRGCQASFTLPASEALGGHRGAGFLPGHAGARHWVLSSLYATGASCGRPTENTKWGLALWGTRLSGAA